MTEITINPFDAQSVRAACQKAKDFDQRFRRNQEAFVCRLAQAGLEVARVRFEAALADYDGDRTPPELTVEVEGNTARLVASGRTVAFLEFGTGVSHPEHSTGLFRHGTYGKGMGRRRQWGYYDEGERLTLTTGNDPAEAMTGAVQEMAARAAEIAREVFDGGAQT